MTLRSNIYREYLDDIQSQTWPHRAPSYQEWLLAAHERLERELANAKADAAATIDALQHEVARLRGELATSPPLDPTHDAGGLSPLSAHDEDTTPFPALVDKR